MKRLISFALAALCLPMFSYAQSVQTTNFNNSPISDFTLNRYLGTWYEIARFDHTFERGMENVTAEYLLRDDGKVDVLNSGWKDGKFKIAEGKATKTEYADKIAERQQWRDDINAAKDEIERLDALEPDPEEKPEMES